jgi:tRNA-dihydrouridine synthase A
LIARGLDGVMVGRSAYHDPASVLVGADRLWGDDTGLDAYHAVAAMKPYIAAHLERGGRLHQITRHMLGAFTGRPGARGWRRVLSEGASRPGAGIALLEQALAEVQAADSASAA